MKSELDRILDDGLGSYCGAEPRVGLERRVLAQVRSSGRRRALWLGWAAVAAAAVLLLAVALRSPHEPPRPAPVVAQMPAAELKKSVAPVPVAARHVTAKRRGATLPKKDVFPSVVPPLTREERALVAWASKAPELFEQPSLAPIEIPEIKIEPLNGN
jgi:hypothetical protein